MGHDDGQRGCKKDNHPRAPLKCCFNERRQWRRPRMRKHSCPTLLLQLEMTAEEHQQREIEGTVSSGQTRDRERSHCEKSDMMAD